MCFRVCLSVCGRIFARACLSVWLRVRAHLYVLAHLCAWMRVPVPGGEAGWLPHTARCHADLSVPGSPRRSRLWQCRAASSHVAMLAACHVAVLAACHVAMLAACHVCVVRSQVCVACVARVTRVCCMTDGLYNVSRDAVVPSIGTLRCHGGRCPLHAACPLRAQAATALESAITAARGRLLAKRNSAQVRHWPVRPLQ